MTEFTNELRAAFTHLDISESGHCLVIGACELGILAQTAARFGI